jgi:hypothetical protein
LGRLPLFARARALFGNRQRCFICLKCFGSSLKSDSSDIPARLSIAATVWTS